MRWRLRRDGRLIEPSLMDPKLGELQAAKEILGEIFRVRACEVEEMIHSRMEKEEALPEGGLWPETFCMGE